MVQVMGKRVSGGESYTTYNLTKAKNACAVIVRYLNCPFCSLETCLEIVGWEDRDLHSHDQLSLFVKNVPKSEGEREYSPSQADQTSILPISGVSMVQQRTSHIPLQMF